MMERTKMYMAQMVVHNIMKTQLHILGKYVIHPSLPDLIFVYFVVFLVLAFVIQQIQYNLLLKTSDAGEDIFWMIQWWERKLERKNFNPKKH